MPKNSVRLEAHDLECVRDDRTLFASLGFMLEAGHILLLEGPNGSGKTSLLRILSSIRLPDAGRVAWCGEDIYKLGPDYHEHLAYVGHRDGIKQDLSPQENLRIARALGNPSTVHDIDDVLDQFGLYGFEDIPTCKLSAGQQRRLALARLRVTDAPLWILDEPFTSLDREGIEIFEQLMVQHTASGGIIVLTTHHRVRLDGTQVHYIHLSG